MIIRTNPDHAKTHHQLINVYRLLKKSREAKKECDILYTSGISEIYPPDIPVARVISNVKNKNKLFQDVGVEILTDINNLYYVFVIQ